MPVRTLAPRALATLLALTATACSGSTAPEPDSGLAFGSATVALGADRTGDVELSNVGERALGPVLLSGGAFQDPSGTSVPGSRLLVDPGEIATLNPGEARLVSVSVALQGTLQPGAYDAVLVARVAGEEMGRVEVTFEVGATGAPVGSLRILADPTEMRTGDVLPLPIDVRDDAGQALDGASVAWSVEPSGAGLVAPSGNQFVGYDPGAVRLVARAGDAADTLDLSVVERALSGSFSVAGRALETDRFTSDLWLHGSVAYSGTWGGRQGPAGTLFGNVLNVWDVSDAAGPTRTATLQVDARTVNDVKVRADGRLAVLTHEGSNDGQNGVSLLDLSNPREPRVIGRFTDELQSGVHNAWLDGDWLYLVVDGVGNGLRVLDVSDPSRPSVVGRYWAGESFLHDVFVRDGLAFLSHWNAGLIILDVGHGIRGGSPGTPVEVARLASLGGQTHNAWYWPEAGYVFVGEEDTLTPGVMHVVDVRNVSAPREVATFRVPGQTPHNFWLDEAAEVLYLAWYGNGIRALDVSGELLGELDRQGREISGALYNGGGGSCARGATATCTWAPQLHEGLVWVSDMNQGLVALQPPR